MIYTIVYLVFVALGVGLQFAWSAVFLLVIFDLFLITIQVMSK